MTKYLVASRPPPRWCRVRPGSSWRHAAGVVRRGLSRPGDRTDLLGTQVRGRSAHLPTALGRWHSALGREAHLGPSSLGEPTRRGCLAPPGAAYLRKWIG